MSRVIPVTLATKQKHAETVRRSPGDEKYYRFDRTMWSSTQVAIDAKTLESIRRLYDNKTMDAVVCQLATTDALKTVVFTVQSRAGKKNFG